ncbi:transposase, partial [Amphritea sp. ZJ14W]|nr:transposase [Amphritea pacifica]
IARRANQEDSCRGHFWEARFKSQALLDEQALLSCMAYVDLNPIRAGIAETPEQSAFTSVKQRIDTPQEQEATALTLKRFDPRQAETAAISYDLHDYLELVDYTGRAIHPTKRGYIAADTPPILARLGIDTDHWLQLMRPQGIHIATVIGHSTRIEDYL